MKKTQASARQGKNGRENAVYTPVHEAFETAFDAVSRRMRFFQHAARWLCYLSCALLLSQAVSADVTITQGSNFGVDVNPDDGRIAMDLLGKIWLLPARGGQAKVMTDGLAPARRPRWSPDGSRILYQTNSPQGARLWSLDPQTATVTAIGDDAYSNQHATWHPSGERIVFASDRRDSGFDIWETDLPTGLSWRLSDHPGDETEPVWSWNGRHLAYIRHFDAHYSLVLRRYGAPEVELLVSDQPLSAPSWRPDGTLITIRVQEGGGYAIDMVILSDPPLVRRLVSGEDVFAAPVSWANRGAFYYTANGSVRTRRFADLQSRPLEFRARIAAPRPRQATTIARRELELVDPPGERLVIRGARLFDGVWERYRHRMDVLVDGGRISQVVARREWEDATVLDLGDVTVVPGFIDVWSAMPAGVAAGAQMLAYGVTTIVTDEPVHEGLPWEGDEQPGPRVLSAADITAEPEDDGMREVFFVKVPAAATDEAQTLSAISRWRDRGVPVVADSITSARAFGADLLIGIDALAAVPPGGPYQDAQLAAQADAFTLISGLADSGTPGISSLLSSRQAREFRHITAPPRRFAGVTALTSPRSAIVLGSKPNGLPPGIALHAELRALAAAGLDGVELLKTTGSNAASMLGLDNQIGQITPGAFADLVLVNGDPLSNPSDALSVVAVVRNGRFYSLVGLLEKAGGGVE